MLSVISVRRSVVAQQMGEIAREKTLEFLRERAKVSFVDKVEEEPKSEEDAEEKKEVS